MKIGDGARLMGDSYAVVRRNPTLLWFPVMSTVCLAITAGYWVLEGKSLYDGHSNVLVLVPVVLAALYTLSFVAVFFSVALAGAAAAAVAGDEPTLGAGLDVALSRLGTIAAWAAYSIAVSIAIAFVKSFKGLRIVGDLAQVAWNLATIFVVPIIALDGLDAESARRRSFQLARENWQAETGGLGVLQLALIVPMFLLYVTGRLLAGGRLHSTAAKGAFALVLVAGFAVAVAAGVVRQVFAIELYRTAEA